MKKSVDVTWVDNMKFETVIDGHKLTIDAAEEVGGHNEGFRPKILMMPALAGCTGMDVISILRKMKVDVTYFNVRVEGDISDEHPKKYFGMTVFYEFKGNNLEYNKLERAVNLSIEKYCGVTANYRESMKMDFQIIILENKVV
jgi:putative redox protein